MTPPMSPSPPTAPTKRRRVLFLRVAVAAFSALCVLVAPIVSHQQSTRSPYQRTQNDLTLLSVYHDPTADRFSGVTLVRSFMDWLQHLWTPLPPKPRYPSIIIALPDNATPLYGAKLPVHDPVYAAKVSMRSSTGDRFALNDAEFVMVSPKNGGKATNYCIAKLPKPGVPANYQWMDMTVDDQNGHRGTWRVWEFPRLKHVLSPTSTLHEKESVHHISLQARAWWDAQSAPPRLAGDSTLSMPVIAEIKALVPPVALSHPSHLWGIKIVSMTQEWDDPTTNQSMDFGTSGTPIVHSSRPLIGPGTSWAEAQTTIAPRPFDQHLTRLEAKLTEYDATEETVTFRNLFLDPHKKGLIVRVPAGGLSQTTKSGVRVLITDQSQWGKSTVVYKPNMVRLLYSLSPNSPPQRYKTSGNKQFERKSFVTGVALDKSGFYSVINYDPYESGSPCAYLLLSKQLPHPILNQLTIRVSQQTELQTVPVIFTVPVHKGKPKEAWNPF